MEQRTDEWFEARRGKITCSRMINVYRHTKSYVIDLAMQRLGKPIEVFTMGPNHPATQGIELEPYVLCLYELRKQVDTTKHGFIIHPDLDYFGGSPDALTEEAVVEIKCVNPKLFYETEVLIPADKMAQVQALMCVCGKQVADLVFYSKDLNKMHIKRVEAQGHPRLLEEVRIFDMLVREQQRLLEDKT